MPNPEQNRLEDYPKRYLEKHPNALPLTERAIEMAEASDLFETAAVNAKKVGLPNAERTCRIMAYYAAERAGRDHDLGINTETDYDYGRKLIPTNQRHVYDALRGVAYELADREDYSDYWPTDLPLGRLVNKDITYKNLGEVYAVFGIEHPDKLRSQTVPIVANYKHTIHEFPTIFGITLMEENRRIDPRDSGITLRGVTQRHNL